MKISRWFRSGGRLCFDMHFAKNCKSFSYSDEAYTRFIVKCKCNFFNGFSIRFNFFLNVTLLLLHFVDYLWVYYMKLISKKKGF